MKFEAEFVGSVLGWCRFLAVEGETNRSNGSHVCLLLSFFLGGGALNKDTPICWCLSKAHKVGIELRVGFLKGMKVCSLASHEGTLCLPPYYHFHLI